MTSLQGSIIPAQGTLPSEPLNADEVEKVLCKQHSALCTQIIVTNGMHLLVDCELSSSAGLALRSINLVSQVSRQTCSRCGRLSRVAGT